MSFVDEKNSLLALLMKLSVERRPVTLSSGQTSDIYIDCKQTVLTGEGHVLVGRCFSELLARAEHLHPHAEQPRHLAVGGLTMGADPLASATCLMATLEGRTLNAIYVRKEPKGHGTGAYLEGTKAVPVGSRVAIVEDVVTTGNATKTAVLRLREHGYIVDTVLALVDRDAGGKAALEALGLRLHALFQLQDVAGPA